MAITIEVARIEDIPLLKAVEVECKLSAWSRTAYEAELKRPDAIILTAVTDSNIVGFIAGRRPLIMDADAEINNVGVLREFRGKGVGSRLIQEFTRICVARRAAMIWLEVRPSNHAAIALYRRHGFVPRGIRRNFYQDPIEDAQLMSLSLIPGFDREDA
jgi:[ribosomal protein S18]-alanine N-acetyltransferase